MEKALNENIIVKTTPDRQYHFIDSLAEMKLTGIDHLPLMKEQEKRETIKLIRLLGFVFGWVIGCFLAVAVC